MRRVAFGTSRYPSLLAFGTTYSVGAQMAGVSVVLPFLLAQKGIFWAAGLLYPPSVLDRSRRNHLLLNQKAAGAVLTVAATLLVLPLVSGRDPVEGRIDVLWLGAAAMAAACVAATVVGPTTSGAPRSTTRFVDDFREGVTVARTRNWCRLFLATPRSPRRCPPSWGRYSA